jgi:hypothetical protein
MAVASGLINCVRTLHSRRAVHGQLTPGHVLLFRNGEAIDVKLADLVRMRMRMRIMMMMMMIIMMMG